MIVINSKDTFVLIFFLFLVNKKWISHHHIEAVSKMDKDNLHRIYHDTAYGFPITNDDGHLSG